MFLFHLNKNNNNNNNNNNKNLLRSCDAIYIKEYIEVYKLEGAKATWKILETSPVIFTTGIVSNNMQHVH